MQATINPVNLLLQFEPPYLALSTLIGLQPLPQLLLLPVKGGADLVATETVLLDLLEPLEVPLVILNARECRKYVAVGLTWTLTSYFGFFYAFG